MASFSFSRTRRAVVALRVFVCLLLAAVSFLVVRAARADDGGPRVVRPCPPGNVRCPGGALRFTS